MNGVLKTIFANFWAVLGFLTFAVASIVVIRISINFNLNEFLRDRRQNYMRKARNACPHMELSVLDNSSKDKEFNIKIRSWFVSPAGSFQYQCQRCGLIVSDVDQNDLQKRGQYFINNPDEYTKTIDRYKKYLKKAGAL